MAIFTFTASKATPRKGINYIMDRDKVELLSVWNLDPNADFAQQMMITQRLWKKGNNSEERKYYHLKIAFSPEDKKENGGSLTKESALKFALDLCHREFSAAEAVIAVQSHGKTRHIHIIVNAVDPMTGKKLQFSDHYQRVLKNLVQYQMCREYGLEAMDWEKATKEKRKAEKEGSTKYAKTVVEQRIGARQGHIWKDELRDIIDAAKEEAENREEFEKLLAEQGVTLSRSTARTISYVLGAHPAVRGNRLGDAYTVEAVKDALERNSVVQRSGLDTLIVDAQRRGAAQTKTSGRSAGKTR